MTMDDGPPAHPFPGRRWAAGLLFLLGGNALVAGYGFVGDPDGTAVGIPEDWLEGTPFTSYLVPGLLLSGLGVLAVAAAVLQLRRHRLAWFWAGLSAGGFVVWIVVQSAMMGSFRHPLQTLLQAAVISIAGVVGLLALWQWRRLARTVA